MVEWLYEEGIGEARALLIDAGTILEACIEPADGGLRVGAVLLGRLVEKQAGGRRGIVRSLDGLNEAFIDPLPPSLDLGRTLTISVVREAIYEPGAVKRAKVRISTAEAPASGPSLEERILSTGIKVTRSNA